MLWCPSRGLWMPPAVLPGLPADPDLLALPRIGSIPSIVGRRNRRPAGKKKAGAPPLSPADWWDPALQAYQDTGTATPATANNAPVAHLLSQTGTGHDLANTGATDRPLLVTGALNGHPALAFDGSNDFLKTALSQTGGITVVMALKIVAWVSNGTVWSDTVSSQPNVTMSGTTPQLKLFTLVTGSGDPVTGGAAVGSWVVLSAKRQLTLTKSIRTNLNARSSFSQGGSTDNALAGFALGSFKGASGFASVQVGRVALYGSALSDADEDSVCQSFGTYYGLF